MATISVIIPAYNIEEYLSACLDSVLSQKFKDFEIIIVDDGSTDNTPKICDEYQKKFSQISVLHQKNTGLSAARNAGIKKAKGEYLALIDGDDLIAKDFLSHLYQTAIETTSDIVICDFLEFSKTPPHTAGSHLPTTTDGQAAAIRLLVGQENRDVIACNKLYKRALFKDIKYPVGALHEDNLTTYKLLAKAHRVAIAPEALYFYRRREGSITAEQDIRSSLEAKERAAREAIQYFKNSKELHSAAEIALLLSYFAYLDNIAAGRIKDQTLWQETIKKIKASKKSYLNNPYLTKKLKLYLALIKIPFIYKLFRKIIH